MLILDQQHNCKSDTAFIQQFNEQEVYIYILCFIHNIYSSSISVFIWVNHLSERFSESLIKMVILFLNEFMFLNETVERIVQWLTPKAKALSEIAYSVIRVLLITLELLKKFVLYTVVWMFIVYGWNPDI